MKKISKSVIWYFVAILVIFLGIGQLSTAILPGILFLLAGIILLPPIGSRINNGGYKKIKNAAVILTIIIAYILAPKTDTDANLASNEVVQTSDNGDGVTITVAPTTEITITPVAEEVITPSATPTETVTVSPAVTDSLETDNDSITYKGISYKIIKVDGGDLSGERLPNVAVDIGYGDREYWGLTNDYGQLVYVIADKITLQDAETESVLSDGRYYSDEANVPGTEQEDLDQGHVIADSLGGVSNAYNITPQDSTLNRYGDQAYMEKVIRDFGGCENFVATITYPDTKTQIPSHYKYEYVLNGDKVVDEFDNVNPDEVNSSIGSSENDDNKSTDTTFDESNELSKIDTNGNGIVTIAEAKAAGFAMPIYKDDWLYKYMKDNDNDGMVGE